METKAKQYSGWVVKGLISSIFATFIKFMKKYFLLFIILGSTLKLSAQNEVGPDGGKLLWLLLIVLAAVLVFFVLMRKGNKKRPLFAREKIKIELDKDRRYFPDNLTLNVKNAGNTEVDLDRPLLVFDNFWLKRKFRLSGTNNRVFYPLYMSKGYNHTLNIDLNHFYSYDKKLKRYPKVKITIFNVKGKRLGSSSIYLRKTLIKF
ncbi:MAG TPA: hypothetical protein P5210_04215 [Draconibacterium sp.]|nr:hypothetical protein [Draconibacterium sp.]HRX10831.1 hypothetical protein [Draconibacterium sp.]